MGYLINEYGIYKINKGNNILIPTKTEEYIFKILKMEYKLPEKRI
jgi:DNA polymerase/3'-5' exonuclease PolX